MTVGIDHLYADFQERNKDLLAQNAKLTAENAALLAALEFAIELAPMLIANSAQVEHWRELVAKAKGQP